MARSEGTILIVDDDTDILTAGRLLLQRRFERVVTSGRPEAIPELLERERPDAVLLDMNFGPGESDGTEGFRWLERILTIDPGAAVVMITAHGGVDVAVEAMKRGATDFVSKPWENERVVATLSAAVRLRRSRAEAERLALANRELAAASRGPATEILGRSDAMKGVLSLVRRAAPTDANVLVLGENGTGKELVAHEIHRQSLRAEKAILSVDLGSIPESLFESELFGHVKGSFTGARENRLGRFLAADGGTIFLDEIGNIPLHLQAKLLTVLEQRQVTPVGSDRPSPVNVRVVSATNLPRRDLSDASRFRPDLLFRLNTVEIALPPLRERRADIPEMVEVFLASYCRKYGTAPKTVTPRGLDALVAWDWPGNVRDLRHAVERAVILSEGDDLDVEDFRLPVPAAPAAAAATPRGPTEAEDLNLERLERRAVERALALHSGNIARAARELGLTRAALYRRLEKHGLETG